jgi:DNA-directed RNA polymerase specialized sigma24 family protein
MASDYARMSELAFLMVRDPVAAEVVAVDAVLAAKRKPLAPDAPAGLHRARRTLFRHAMAYIRRRRYMRLLPWVKKRGHGLELSEGTQRVWDAVSGLRPRQQAAIVMARVEGATLAEIADALEFSTAAAGSHLDKARDALRAKLGDVDLRVTLTRELGIVARSFTNTYRPDVSTVAPLLRSGRWRGWAVAAGAVAIGAAVVFSLVRG